MGKRLLDLFVAVPALVGLSPVLMVVAAAVRWKHGSPVLFRQLRAGQDADAILVPKFRSMTDERDQNGQLLADGQRLTPFGAKLRSTSLDELPQLWAVIKGDMSLVGPRPLPTVYVDRYNAEQRRRLEAKPGMTGWAQVNGRNDTTWAVRLAHDVWYVDNASLWVDLEILARTLRMIVRRRGVTAPDHVTMREFIGD